MKELENTIEGVLKIINTSKSKMVKSNQFKEFANTAQNLIQSVKHQKSKRAEAKKSLKVEKKAFRPRRLKRKRQTELQDLESGLDCYLSTGYISSFDGIETRSRKRRRLAEGTH